MNTLAFPTNGKKGACQRGSFLTLQMEVRKPAITAARIPYEKEGNPYRHDWFESVFRTTAPSQRMLFSRGFGR